MWLVVGGGGEEDQHERQREAVVEAGLDVEQAPQPQRHVRAAHDRGGEHRVGRREDRTDEERRGPVQPGEEVGGDGDADHRERHGQPECPPRQPPRVAQRGQAGALAVGEQHREQRDVGERRDERAVGGDVDDAEPALAEQRARREEQQCGRQDGPGRESRQ
ncbi:hypothetical protein H4W32_001634 [Actinophytocola algeriensis]|uniref:Uncharacterized protein n=1 Tax=Actinophytocola algeriensis TaxID=1768010 RepID=A0A7W7QFJ6_9PSEU|nr:hypothetical protein [Actinophytocola algeriensis]MBE1473592.1 hypothetical protein [Actinophytocola algeriensis]